MPARRSQNLSIWILNPTLHLLKISFVFLPLLQKERETVREKKSDWNLNGSASMLDGSHSRLKFSEICSRCRKPLHLGETRE